MTPGRLTGDRVNRISWQPGDDTLIGTCHCGARHLAQDPITMWEWLLAHPVGHTVSIDMPARSAPREAVPA